MNSHEKTSIYRLKLLPSVRFIRRPISLPPAEGQLCFIDRGTADVADRYSGAWYRDGIWTDMKDRPLKAPPTFWTEMVTDD